MNRNTNAARKRLWRRNDMHTEQQRNPAGTKIVRGFYRAKFGVKGNRKEAREWYQSLKFESGQPCRK